MQFSTPGWHHYERASAAESAPAQNLKKPVLGVDELGVTVVSKDPMTGGHIVQNVDAAIRQGASKMQLVFSQPHTNPVGGGAKSFGKDVRENIREIIRANGVSIEGVEMPTSSMTNLSGFDPQRGNISEQKRRQDLDEVKEAIHFIADAAGGGGVDIWSQEFQRSIVDASWNTDPNNKWAGKFEAYEGEDQYATEYLVDQRTGQIMSEIRHSSDIFEPVFETATKSGWGKDIQGKDVFINEGDYVTRDGERIDPTDREQLLMRAPKWDPKNKSFEVRQIKWNDIKDKTKDFNKRYGTDYDPAEYAFKLQMETNWMQTRGQSLYYTQRYEQELKQLDALKESLEYYKKLEENTPKEDMWRLMKEDPSVARFVDFAHGEMMRPTELIQQNIDQIHHSLKHVHEASAAADAKAKELQITMDEGVRSMKKYAKEKAIESYAEAGIEAFRVSTTNPTVKKNIHVGPEIGWPTGWGGHPEEFIELIQGARKQMAKELIEKEGYSKEEAKQVAKEHLKGCFDTGHMGMWYQHFKKEHPSETEEQRLGRFKGWYMEMVKKMQKADVIGGIQAVDSAGGGHAHLPTGQGILGNTIVEAVDYLKGEGWGGFVVSEGHEEEQYGKGRIMLETWKAFGADIADSYFAAPAPQSWGGVQDQYFGAVNPPPYVVGAYSPSEDWTFWSGTPLE